MNDQANTPNVQKDFTNSLVAMQTANQERIKLINSITNTLNRIKFEGGTSLDPNSSVPASELTQKPTFIMELNLEIGKILKDNDELQRIVQRLNELI